MSTTRGDHAPRAIADLQEATSDANNLLLLTDTLPRPGQTQPPDASDLLLVSLNTASDAQKPEWESAVVNTFDRVRIIRATPPTQEQPAAPEPDSISVRSIDHPTNLTDLGRYLADYLTSEPTAEQHTFVSFHSITTLLAHMDIHRVFYFLHLVTSRIKATNAIAYFYLHPTAHHPTNIRTLSPLFDRHLRALPDNRWATASARGTETEYL